MLTTVLWSACFLISGGFFLWQIYGRFGVLLKLRRDDGRHYSAATFARRLKTALVYGIAQRKFFRGEQPAGLMHVAIFWGFCVLSLQVVTMFLRGWFPEFRVPGLGMHQLGPAYGILKDSFEVTVVLGVCYALYRWLIKRPTRLYGFLPAEKKLRGQSHWEAIVILLFISTIMISGLVYDAARMVVFAQDPEMALERTWQPVSAFIATFFDSHPESAPIAADAAWWIHNLVILVFVNLLPRSKHFHIITSIPNVFLGKMEPKGTLAKRDLSSDNPLFGRSTPNQFTWKQALDMYSCTECGRCSSMCPATATGKPLAPRQFLLNLRDSLYAAQPALLKPAVAGSETTFETVVGEGKLIDDSVIWSCVECRACEEACPVNIEYVDKIVDIRQHLVQEASRFPSELNRAFKGMETQSNPWGISKDERDVWAQGFDVPRLADKPNAEYLYYVGCGGAFDDNNRKGTRAFTSILKQAGVDFAIMGKDELCNGDSARRLGNEYLYQSMAEGLVQTLNAANVKKILVNCPHCFNTIKNEYPQFGGKYEVIHAAAFVSKLKADGKIKVDGEFNKNVVYHDSCYYGRFNDIYDEPRDLLCSLKGSKLGEMDRCKSEGMCCGAGGGRMWMEEPADQRVNVLRTEQALEKKPDVIATSCPFCRIMIGSGVNEKGVADKVAVMDVMEVVAQGMAAKAESPAPTPT